MQSPQTRVYPALRIINPATGALIQQIEEDSPASIREKFARAVEGQKAWARVPLTQRMEAVRKFWDLVIERRETLAAILTSEVGKPLAQSRNELNGLVPRLDYFLENTERVLADEIVHAEKGLEERISYEPLGVILNISAWNYPYFVGSNVFIPALLAGNAVLYKPSEFATLTGLAITGLLHESGIPQDAFISVVGGGAVGANLLTVPAAGVFFTGSYPTGLKVAEAAAAHLMKVQLELGGKDPIYVCDDADVANVAEAVADGAFYNTGQSCCSVERIYVHERVAYQFIEAFVATVRGFMVGDPTDDATYVGPVTRTAQLGHLARQVEDAKGKGARLLCGGNAINRTGNFFEPTVFTGVDHTMDLMREETFGPLIGIQTVASDDEAVRLMNDTEYGLTAGVYTTDKNRAESILARVNAGSAYWNCCDRVSPRLPWSGRGHSGLGATLSKAGILAFVQPKAWHLKPG